MREERTETEDEEYYSDDDVTKRKHDVVSCPWLWAVRFSFSLPFRGVGDADGVGR